MNNYFKKLFFSAITLIVILLAPAAFSATTVIDVLVVYTKGTTDLYGSDPSTRFNQLFQVTNQIYKDSGVDVEIRLAKSQLVDYTDDNNAGTALDEIAFAKNPAFSGIAALRDQVKADMVLFYRPYKAVHGSCGIAYVAGGANGDFSNRDWVKYMYAHVAINSCGDYVTAHELGHNMGLKHSRKQDGSGGVFPYALGYGVMNKFTTIMAYQSVFNADYWTGKLYKFSNPELTCMGEPCGINRNDTANGADAHYALNITAPQIAKFNLGSAASSSTQTSSASSSKSSLASSKASSTSSSAKSSVSGEQLNTLLAKLTSTKADYDAALAAFNANRLAIEQKTKAEANALALFNAATGAYAKAQSVYSEAGTQNASAIADSKSAVALLKTAQAAYNKSTDANRAANKKALDAAQAVADKAQAKALAAANMLATTKDNVATTKSALATMKTNYATAQKATEAEKKLTDKLSAKLNTATSAYSAAQAAYKAVAPAAFTRVADVAQYRGADWKNEVRRESGISLDRAKEIAAADPNITYFFITTGYQMILEATATSTNKGVFHFGDTVFFSGKPWYGSAPGLADAYEKSQ